MKLVQVRECDAWCCNAQPRFPHDGTCKYLKDGRCDLFTNPSLAEPDEVDRFVLTCKRYPQFTKAGHDTLGCCWQWRTIT